MFKWIKKYKYDVICFILWILYWLFLALAYNITLHNIQYWILLIFTILFRLCGYKEGFAEAKTRLKNVLMSGKFDIAETSVNQKQHTLESIKPGTVFSLVKDADEKHYVEPLDKYIKLESSIGDVMSTWNLTKSMYKILSNDTKVILYDCSSVYMPK